MLESQCDCYITLYKRLLTGWAVSLPTGCPLGEVGVCVWLLSRGVHCEIGVLVDGKILVIWRSMPSSRSSSSSLQFLSSAWYSCCRSWGRWSSSMDMTLCSWCVGECHPSALFSCPIALTLTVLFLLECGSVSSSSSLKSTKTTNIQRIVLNTS